MFDVGKKSLSFMTNLDYSTATISHKSLDQQSSQNWRIVVELHPVTFLKQFVKGGRSVQFAMPAIPIF